MIRRKIELCDTLKRFLAFGVCFFMLCSVRNVTFASDVPDAKQKPEEKSKVYLLHSDMLRYNQQEMPGVRILNGDVRFRHNDVFMYCDSAHFYENENSFEAFRNVRMNQGDTLTLVGDYLFYDGNTQIAQVRRNVKMTHRQSVLYTDSLNYDRLYDLGYFFEGGKLVDGDNVLVSDWGEYSPTTRMAVFNYNVTLTNPSFTLKSDTLQYNTLTKLAHIVGPSNIESGSSHIYSESGYYNTQTERARLLDRSVVLNGESRLVGDSLFYDKLSGDMYAYNNVVYEDKVNKSILTGNFCTYNEQTGKALATDSAVARDYSNPADTLFVHADTFRLFSYDLNTDTLYRVLHAYKHVRAFRTDIQAVCDSLVFGSKTKELIMYDNPIVWNARQQLLGEEIHVFMNDSTVDSVHVVNQALLAEELDSLHYNQIAGRLMKSYFEAGQIRMNQVIGNVQIAYYPLDSDSLMIGLNRAETSEMRMFMKDKKMERIWTPPATGVLYPLALAPADQLQLETFAWFDYIRPRDKHDIFEWRAKRSGTELKPTLRRQIPLQQLEKLKNKLEKEK